jgi:nucleoside-diphosphate-sugar epimerase
MRVVVTGASGNVGTSVLEALGREAKVEEIVGIARRVPQVEMPKVHWFGADVVDDDLVPIFSGADAVVHLAWAIQPSREERVTERINVEGSRRVFEAAARAGVRAIVHASSVGAYSPGLIFKSEAASVPLIPRVPRLRFQAVHSRDVGEAYRQAVVRDVQGAFNLAAEPEIGVEELQEFFGARSFPLPAGALRAAADVTWKLRLQPSSPGWIDLALGVPMMDSGRAREELAWEPEFSSLEALDELLQGMRNAEGAPTPPLDPKAGGPMRAREVATGVGQRQGT